MTATVLPIQVIEAPETWRTVDFISDLHLQEKDTETFKVWRDYMASTSADAVFILGDLFEVCLLYTSPSPRDRQKARMPSSA